MAGCVHPRTAPAPVTEAPLITTLTGTARNAKGGAVVVQDDGQVIYLLGLPSWPDEADGRRVRASGVQVERKLFPDPVNEKGELVQGALGTQQVLQDARWELEPAS